MIQSYLSLHLTLHDKQLCCFFFIYFLTQILDLNKLFAINNDFTYSKSVLQKQIAVV